MAEVTKRGLLNSSFWCKALKVHQWEEKKSKKQKKTMSSFARQLHLASIPLILINHPCPIQKTFYMEMKSELLQEAGNIPPVLY